MSELDSHIPEQHPRRRRPVTIGSVFAAGTLLIGACTPSQPIADASPVADGVSPAASRSCEPTPPRCPTPASPAPTETPSTITFPSVCNWLDQDGKRQPPVSTKPLTVAVDGRCSPHPYAPVPIYEHPELKNSHEITRVSTGAELVVLCMVKTPTHYMDIRGRKSASNVVLRVGTENGHVGYVSEPPVGYIDETQLQIPRCRFDE